MRVVFTLFSLLFSLTVFSQKEIPGKISPELSRKLVDLKPSDSIDIVISLDKINPVGMGRVINKYPAAGVYQIRLAAASVQLLAQNDQVRFIDAWHQPKEELTTASLDIATNMVNLVHHQFPGINGDSIIISIKENRFDTTDLDIRGRIIAMPLASPSGTAHATIMATTAAGAGNSSPFGKGAAWLAYLTSSDFINLLPDPDAVFDSLNITVQNHSYGTVIQNYYGAEARAYDVNAARHPSLLHVFSAGNSGSVTPTTGAYAGIAGVANLTGNFKWSKNSVAVGAIDSFYQVSPLSSKGPAPDGRIKPELVAFGQDGSSGAAALVSGAAALVQHAYKRMHADSLPLSSLVKAVLLNSAKDVGLAGIDHSAGYGSLNAFGAVHTVVENRLKVDSLSSLQAMTIPLTLPANAARLSVTLAWTDPAAAVNAPKALVNDLDLAIKNTTTGETWLPWVLNTKAHVDSLRLPALRKRDTLNNVEQVSIEGLAPGNYSIEINANNLSTARQPFGIAWAIDTTGHFTWTYPTASDALESGKSAILRWISNRNEAVVLEYSSNGGAWQTVASVPDARLGYYEWTLPDSFITARLRMRFTAAEFLSDSFVISRPLQIHTGFNCKDSFLLFWDKAPVSQYQVYAMQGKLLQPLLQTPDTFHVFTNSPSLHYAVAPMVNGKAGLRGNTLFYPGDGTGCYFKSFYLQSTNGPAAFMFLSIGTLYSVKSITLQKLGPNGFIDVSTITDPQLKEFNLTDPAMKKGVNVYRVQLTLHSGQVLYSDVIFGYYFEEADVIIYPNPVQAGSVIHLLSNKAGRQLLNVYNSSGQRVLTLRIRELRQDIPTGLLQPGVYFFHITDDEGKRIVEKVILY